MVSPAVRLVASCVLGMVALVACGGESGSGGDDRPSISPTASPELPSPTASPDLPSPTASPDLPTPTRSRTPTPSASSDTTEPSPDQETTTSPVESPEQSEAPESSPTPGSGDATAEDGDGDGGEDTPSWVWWLLGIAGLVSVALVAWLMTRSRRRHAWLAELKDAEAEVDWVAYTLLPGLRRTGSLEQVAGGWLVGAARVEAVEDRLTVLESSASRDEDRARAQGLRDAVRLARGRMQELAAPGPHESWAHELDEVIASLETALGPSRPATRT